MQRPKSAYRRRTFLRRAGGAAAVVASPALLSAGSLSAEDRVVLATIGCGGRGSPLTRDFAARKDVTVACVADVDARRAGSLAKALEGATGRAPLAVTDYRRALELKEVHAVVVAKVYILKVASYL